MKKLEDRAGQLGREKEELSQALIALKKGQSIAAGPGQTRMVNLMRRVHTLVRRKPYILDNTQLSWTCMLWRLCSCAEAAGMPLVKTHS